MAKKDLDARIGRLFLDERWDEAIVLLEKEREKDPHNHWVLTQLGVAFYEKHEYENSLKLFLSSLQIKDDCPLTLWNLAGVLDALRHHEEAVRIYTWLLGSGTSPEKDPCWESREWTESLKTDCMYRLGVCFEHLGKKQKAERWYRQYLNLLSLGFRGTYSPEVVINKILGLHQPGRRRTAGGELRKAVEAMLPTPETGRGTGRMTPPPKFTPEKFSPGRRVASKNKT